MEPEGIHELTAAYALAALDERETQAYEAHLRHCSRCRDDLVALREAATSLAYAAPATSPPAALRGRILEQARAERSNVVSLPRRLRDRRTRILAAATAVAAAAAVALGIWAAVLHSDLDSTRSAHARDAQALALLAEPGTDHVPLTGASGMLAVASSGKAVLLLSAIAMAPSDRTYEAWVIKGKQAQPAGLFQGGANRVVPLTRPVPEGATVGVTIERKGGAPQPTSAPIVSAKLSSL